MTLHEVNHGGYVPSVPARSFLPSRFKHTPGTTSLLSSESEDICLKTFLYPLFDCLAGVLVFYCLSFTLAKVRKEAFEV